MSSPSQTDTSAAGSPQDPGHPSGGVHQGHTGGNLVRAWIAVVLMILGFGLAVLALPVESARWPLLIAGGVVGLAGVITGAVGGLMNNVE